MTGDLRQSRRRPAAGDRGAAADRQSVRRRTGVPGDDGRLHGASCARRWRRRSRSTPSCCCLASVFVGTYVLEFFGLSVPIVQVAGGIVVCAAGGSCCARANATPIDPATRRRAAQKIASRAFYPLTLPLTVGPGTISVAITIGANHPQSVRSLVVHGAADVIGAVLVAATVFVCYRYADRDAALPRRDGDERAGPAVGVHPVLHRRADLLDRASALLATLPAPAALMPGDAAESAPCVLAASFLGSAIIYGLPATPTERSPGDEPVRGKCRCSSVGRAAHS